jgi:aryl-alcohol dehydrogenase-like predicted oxidoreductase
VRACESSLRRLQTDRIDLYWVHVDDEGTPLEETMAALDELVREGKVLHIGASNYRAYRLMKALDISDRLGSARFIGFQGQYNLIVRTLEREHVRLFSDEGIGLVSWSPLAGGMLTGKVRPGVSDPGGSRLEQRDQPTDQFRKNERGFVVAAMVGEVARDLGCTPAQVALAWQRTRPVASVILGTRTLDQLDDNLGSLGIDLPPAAVERLDAATAPEPEYPGHFIDLLQGRLRAE